MKLGLFAYSRQGIQTACRIRALFDDAQSRIMVPERLKGAGLLTIQSPSKNTYADSFQWADCLIFVSSCGIAVRQIAPHVKDKMKDPAVLCVDELGKFTIALLSGHVGGANALAEKVAAGLGAIPVITTATDIHGLFSVDTWAARSGYFLAERKMAKEVSAAVLERTVPVESEYPIVGTIPKGIQPDAEGELGIYIGHYRKDPFQKTLHIVPKVLHLGIGCRRGTSEEAIREAVEKVFAEHALDKRAIRLAASIDLKKDEQGLLDFCSRSGMELRFYTSDELHEAKGEFTPSNFVQSITGVDNVCERAAILGAERILVRKTIVGGVTVSVAAERLDINFG